MVDLRHGSVPSRKAVNDDRREGIAVPVDAWNFALGFITVSVVAVTAIRHLSRAPENSACGWNSLMFRKVTMSGGSYA